MQSQWRASMIDDINIQNIHNNMMKSTFNDIKIVALRNIKI